MLVLRKQSQTATQKQINLPQQYGFTDVQSANFRPCISSGTDGPPPGPFFAPVHLDGIMILRPKKRQELIVQTRNCDFSLATFVSVWCNPLSYIERWFVSDQGELTILTKLVVLWHRVIYWLIGDFLPTSTSVLLGE